MATPIESFDDFQRNVKKQELEEQEFVDLASKEFRSKMFEAQINAHAVEVGKKLKKSINRVVFGHPEQLCHHVDVCYGPPRKLKSTEQLKQELADGKIKVTIVRGGQAGKEDV